MLGLIIIDHGSRRSDANEQVKDMAERIRRLRPQAIIAIAHLEVTPPTLTEAVADVVANGATEIVVLPYFLSQGRHVSTDIPAQLSQALTNHPRVKARIGGALGPHDLLASLLLERGQC